MSDFERLKNERERLMKQYENSSNMLNIHIELAKEYYEKCKELDESINGLDELLQIVKHIKSPS